MYCLHWLIPVLLVPKPVTPALHQTHVMFIVLYLIDFSLNTSHAPHAAYFFLSLSFFYATGALAILFWSINKFDTVKCDSG